MATVVDGSGFSDLDASLTGHSFALTFTANPGTVPLVAQLSALAPAGPQGLVIDPVAKASELTTWSGYKRTAFKPLRDAQEKDGGWQQLFFGRAHATASALIVLQLDNGYLPAFSR